MTRSPILAAIAISALAACHAEPRVSPGAAALQVHLSGKPRAAKAVWADVQQFYEQRQSALAWVSDTGKVTHAQAILSTLAQALDHGLSGEYDRTEIEGAITGARKLQGDATERAGALADLDLRITIALLSLGRDVALGRTAPMTLDARWKPKRTSPDLAGTLSERVDDGLETWLDRVRPVHPEYARLQQGLKALEGQRVKGGWPTIKSNALTPGRSNAAVVMLRQRLFASGELKGTAATTDSPVYDGEITAAVKAFQEHHTLKASGIADSETIAAMNVPIEARIEQVARNLERWRWMPDDFGSRHLLVNIPSYHVIAREDGRDVLDIRVVVGKPGHETPIFSSEMTTVVFSPYWNIPDTIAEGETVPALARDPHYLQRNHIEVMRPTKSGAEPVDPEDIDWQDENATKTLMFRQRPGADNALGHVKFLFPNPFDVYLHDTPADALFSRTGRAFSHGCVRVEEPETLAKYVLRGNSEWDEEKIVTAMHAGVERPVKLPAPIPVHIVYFTATVDENGGLHLLNDVYGYDKKQTR